MSTYFTLFSCCLDLGSTAALQAAFNLYIDYCDELESEDDGTAGFVVDVYEEGGSKLWLRDDGGHGDPEHVIAFVLRCAEIFDLRGHWGFTWSMTCSRPIVDGFGGGAQLLDLSARKSLAWVDCENWLALELADTSAAGRGAMQPISSQCCEAIQRKADHFESLLALLKEPAQPMGLSRVDFERWLPRAIAAVAKAEAISAGVHDPNESGHGEESEIKQPT
jgi:hypothetical protein